MNDPEENPDDSHAMPEILGQALSEYWPWIGAPLWTNIKSPLGQRLIFAGMPHHQEVATYCHNSK